MGWVCIELHYVCVVYFALHLVRITLLTSGSFPWLTAGWLDSAEVAESEREVDQVRGRAQIKSLNKTCTFVSCCLLGWDCFHVSSTFAFSCRKQSGTIDWIVIEKKVWTIKFLNGWIKLNISKINNANKKAACMELKTIEKSTFSQNPTFQPYKINLQLMRRK